VGDQIVKTAAPANALEFVGGDNLTGAGNNFRAMCPGNIFVALTEPLLYGLIDGAVGADGAEGAPFLCTIARAKKPPERLRHRVYAWRERRSRPRIGLAIERRRRNANQSVTIAAEKPPTQTAQVVAKPGHGAPFWARIATITPAKSKYRINLNLR
jgi:hypothetical protein